MLIIAITAASIPGWCVSSIRMAHDARCDDEGGWFLTLSAGFARRAAYGLWRWIAHALFLLCSRSGGWAGAIDGLRCP
jgi:hypothetical protein